MTTMSCSYCKSAGKPESEYSTHWVKENVGGKVVCPALLANECGYCHGIGHTPKFCPKLKARDARRCCRVNYRQKLQPRAQRIAAFTGRVQSQMKQADAVSAAQKRQRMRCSDNQYAALMGSGKVIARKQKVSAMVVGPKSMAPRALQGVWGKVAKTAEAVRNLDATEVSELKALLGQMGIFGNPECVPNAEEQKFLEQTAEQTAEGEAFFDNDADVEEAVVALAAGEAAVALPMSCNLDADFGEAGADGWGSD